VLGRVLSHYQLKERLGPSGLGVLYRATDLKLGRGVTVNVVDPRLATDATSIVRFVRTARAASALEHPNIAKVQEIGELDGEFFIAMAVDQAETLQHRLENGALPFHQAQAILRQLCFGLEAAHSVGTVHGNLKPESVLLTPDGTVKILDFGLAELVSDSEPRTRMQTASSVRALLYRSPEQLSGAQADSRSDVWSLGVLAYEMVAGVSPFEAPSSAATAARILNEEPRPLSTVPGVPNWFAELVSLLLRKNPAERPESATEVFRRLEAGGSDCAVPGSEQAVPPIRATPIRFALALVGIALLAAGGIFYCHWPI
jgi:serine/threonine protein kinase